MEDGEKFVEPGAGPEAVEGADGDQIAWFYSVGAGQPAKRAIALMAAIAAGALGLSLYSLVGFAIGFLAVLFSTAEMFFPYRYVLDSSGAHSRIGFSSSSISWGDVVRIVIDDAGAKLSPVAEGSRLAPFRGIYLRFSGNEGQILGKIAALASHAVTVDRRSHQGGGNNVDPEAGV